MFGLRLKLMFVVVMGLVIGVSILGYFKLQQDRQDIYEAANRSGQERIALISKSFSNLLAGYDYTNMESLADSIILAPDIQTLKLENKNGKIAVERKDANFSNNDRNLIFTAPVTFGTDLIGNIELQISTKELEATLHETFVTLLQRIIGIGMFLALLIYIVASIVVLSPISKIRNTMQSIVANPDGGLQSLEESGNDELADLSRIFNKMQASLHKHQLQLKERVQIADENLIRTNDELTKRSIELEQMVVMAQQLATTDSLTGLKNRRFLDDSLGAFFAQAKRHQDPLCLVLIDVDKFKQINDVYGHFSGDDVLRKISDLMRWRTRDSDINARMGGDEFAFILPRTSVMQGKIFAQNMLESIREHSFVLSADTTLKVTLSIGVAELSDDIKSVEALYGLADKALYESKHRGRNQVTGIFKQEFF